MIKKGFVLFALLTIFLLGSTYKIDADTVDFTIGTVDSYESIVVEDITYRTWTLSTTGPDFHVIHNLEVGRYSEFDVVLHDMLYDTDFPGLHNVMMIAQDYEYKTGKVVYAAVNGDFFSFDSYRPVGFYGVDYNLMELGSYTMNSFGFTSAHKTIVGDVEYGYKINIYDNEGRLIDYVHIDKVNASLEDGEIGVYTDDLSSEVSGNNIAKLAVNEDLILFNSHFHYEGNPLTDIANFTFNDNTYTINNGEFVIAAKGDSPGYQTLINNVESDSLLAIYPYPTGAWEDMQYIIGGYQILLDRGTKLPEPIHGAETARHPRTTIGVDRDGNIGLTVIDGRLVNIPGVTLGELADINQDLGYYTAIELDGGGSSTCLLRNLETGELEVMNTPSDGQLRGVANAVLIVGDPIEDEVTTTEETTTVTTTTITTTETTTFGTTTSAFTTIETTTEPITITETTTISTIPSMEFTTAATQDTYYSNCDSCNSVRSSTIILSVIALMGFFFFRKKI